MLKAMRIGLIAAVAVLTFSVAAPAQADPPDCTTPRCDITIEEPGTDPGPDPETGVTPGPAECILNATGEKIPCTSDSGSWSNASQCYWQLNPNQLPPPPGADPSGAWYLCYNPWDGGEFAVSTNHWLLNPPPGLGLTPGQAARRIVQTMTFEGIAIGMAPDPNPRLGYRRGFVGVPVWMWATNQTAQNWGPYTVTATLGGQTITVDANVTSVLWNMGDGETVSCTGGTPYSVGYGNTDSPSCGHRFSKTSDTNGGQFTVTATSQWAINWSGGGQSGTIPLTTQSTDTIWIDELQSVNTNG